MKAYELHEKEGMEGLTQVERSSPRIGPGEVRVRVRAVSLNFRDLGIVRLRRKPGSPMRIPVSDGAGDVIEVGPGVRTLKVGDRVAGSFFPTWHDGPLSADIHANALGGSIDGMLAEEVVLPERSWVQLPPHLSFEEGATLPCAGVTAFHALFESANLRPGETVLLQGTGGVSIFALQLAKAAGAQVVITSSSADKRARASKMGADHTLDYKVNPKWGDAASAWTQGRGVDVVVEVGGPGTFDQSVQALKYQGTMSILGVLTGTRGEVNTYGVFHKALRVHGVYVGSVAMFEGLNRVLTTHKIHPVIDRVFGFDEARAAYEYLASAQHFGKIVVRVGS